jgi:hypothetical protein
MRHAASVRSEPGSNSHVHPDHNARLIRYRPTGHRNHSKDTDIQNSTAINPSRPKPPTLAGQKPQTTTADNRRAQTTMP